jgi:hypothetical protein
MRTSRASLTDLRGKYAEMLVMRLEHESGAEDAHTVRGRMAHLAARFPGALREIDELALDDLRNRIAAIDTVLDAGTEVPRWMTALVRFHALTRGALVAKRWLGKRRHVDEGVIARFEREVRSMPFPEDSRAWAPELASIASPPRGRVLDAVFRHLGRELGMSGDEARRLVFGELPRRAR